MKLAGKRMEVGPDLLCSHITHVVGHVKFPFPQAFLHLKTNKEKE
jgi:hypothetical protein